ncbi:unnamed protein product, partial [Prorocentrum cordatum]
MAGDGLPDAAALARGVADSVLGPRGGCTVARGAADTVLGQMPEDATPVFSHDAPVFNMPARRSARQLSVPCIQEAARADADAAPALDLRLFNGLKGQNRESVPSIQEVATPMASVPVPAKFVVQSLRSSADSRPDSESSRGALSKAAGK